MNSYFIMYAENIACMELDKMCLFKLLARYL